MVRGQPGAVVPLEFENDDVICCFHAKYPKIFDRAFGARIKFPSIKSKTAKKMAIIFVRAFGVPKNRSFVSVHAVLPLLEKFLWAPMIATFILGLY